MRLRAFGPAVHGFLDTLREGHPTTPIVLMSPVVCPIVEDTPGPTSVFIGPGQRIRFVTTGEEGEVAAGKLTLAVIRSELERIAHDRRRTDRNLHYLDGRALLGSDDLATTPLPDDLHPSAAGYWLMGQ
jgi:hypothetical protein